MTDNGKLMKALIAKAVTDGQRPTIVGGGVVIDSYQSLYSPNGGLLTTSIFVNVANPINSLIGLHVINYDHISAIYTDEPVTASAASISDAGEELIKNILKKFKQENYTQFELGFIPSNVVADIIEIVDVGTDKTIIKCMLSEAHLTPATCRPMQVIIRNSALSWLSMPLRAVDLIASLVPAEVVTEMQNNVKGLNMLNTKTSIVKDEGVLEVRSRL